MSEETDLLRAIVHLMSRQAYPEPELKKIVAPKKDVNHLKAFNLCDGTRNLTKVAIEAGIDQGGFSRMVTRWVESGVMHRLGEGKSPKLLHAYPIQDLKF